MTIVGRDATIVGTGRATIVLPMGTHITIEDALLYPNSKRTLLNYQDIRQNSFHIETGDENNEEFLLITKYNGYGKKIVEQIPSFPSGLYYTYIKHVPHVVYKVIFQNVDTLKIWYDRLGHPGVGMMRKIISNSNGHELNIAKFPKSSDFMCTSCATGKLILHPSHLKFKISHSNSLNAFKATYVAPYNIRLELSGTSWF